MRWSASYDSSHAYAGGAAELGVTAAAAAAEEELAAAAVVDAFTCRWQCKDNGKWLWCHNATHINSSLSVASNTADLSTTSKRAISDCQQTDGRGRVVDVVVGQLPVGSEADKCTGDLLLGNLQAGQQHSACSSLLLVLARWDGCQLILSSFQTFTVRVGRAAVRRPRLFSSESSEVWGLERSRWERFWTKSSICLISIVKEKRATKKFCKPEFDPTTEQGCPQDLPMSGCQPQTPSKAEITFSTMLFCPHLVELHLQCGKGGNWWVFLSWAVCFWSSWQGDVGRRGVNHRVDRRNICCWLLVAVEMTVQLQRKVVQQLC